MTKNRLARLLLRVVLELHLLFDDDWHPQGEGFFAFAHAPSAVRQPLKLAIGPSGMPRALSCITASAWLPGL